MLLMQLARAFADVQRMVRNALKVRDRVKELQNFLVLSPGQLTAGELDQIRSDHILVPVDRPLHPGDQIIPLVRVAAHQADGLGKVASGLLGHGVDGKAALLDGKRRVLEEAFLELHDRGHLVARITLDEEADQRLDHICERKQDHDLDKPEQRVERCNADGRHGHRQE